MFAMSALITALLDRFGRSGALFITGGIMLNVCVCGMLFRLVFVVLAYSDAQLRICIAIVDELQEMWQCSINCRPLLNGSIPSIHS